MKTTILALLCTTTLAYGQATLSPAPSVFHSSMDPPPLRVRISGEIQELNRTDKKALLVMVNQDKRTGKSKGDSAVILLDYPNFDKLVTGQKLSVQAYPLNRTEKLSNSSTFIKNAYSMNPPPKASASPAK